MRPKLSRKGVAAFAEEVLGTREKAAIWLRKPNRALGGVRPTDLLGTATGRLHVEQVLGRIAHGVYS